MYTHRGISPSSLTVALVRRLLGRHAAARPHTLRNSIRNAIKVYRDMHPETTGAEIAATLRKMVFAVLRNRARLANPAAVPDMRA